MRQTSPAEAAATLGQFYPLYPLYPPRARAVLDELAAAVGCLVAALSLLQTLLERDGGRRFGEPQRLLAELTLPPDADALVFAGDDNPPPTQAATSLALNHLGRLLQDYSLLAPARDAYQLAAAHDQAAFGPEHWIVARDLNRLGTVLHDLGELDDALAAYQRALTIDRLSLGPGHPAVARDANNLALLLRDGGDVEQAYRLLLQAASIVETRLGDGHAYTRVVHRHLWQLEQQLY